MLCAIVRIVPATCANTDIVSYLNLQKHERVTRRNLGKPPSLRRGCGRAVTCALATALYRQSVLGLLINIKV